MEKEAQNFRKKGLDVIIARPFNHIGPGQLPGFLVPDLKAKINEALQNSSVVRVGNLKTRRDYTDVRDVASAYVKLATAELQHEIYNICSGKSVSGYEILNMLIAKIPAAKNLRIEVDKSLIRPNDPKNIYGSYERLKKETDWTPKIPIEQTITEILS
jgi:GDP-4-dehydro-6-deoxy-D-mannose reductase